MEIIKVLRKYQPDIVLCNAIDDRHIDHGKGSKLVSDACFLSGLIKIETEYAPNKSFGDILTLYTVRVESVANILKNSL